MKLGLARLSMNSYYSKYFELTEMRYAKAQVQYSNRNKTATGNDFKFAKVLK